MTVCDEGADGEQLFRLVSSHDSDEETNTAVSSLLTQLQSIGAANGIDKVLDLRHGASKYTALHKAAAAVKDATCLTLLRWGADPNSVDVRGRAPLHHAIQASGDRSKSSRVLKTVEVIISSSRCDPDIKDLNSETPAATACTVGNMDVLLVLVATGRIDMNTQDKYGKRLLHRTCQLPTAEGSKLVRMLLETYNLDPNRRDVLGRTPLHIAAANKNTAAVISLLNHGAQAMISDNKGLTALDVAGCREVVEVLRDNLNIGDESSSPVFLLPSVRKASSDRTGGEIPMMQETIIELGDAGNEAHALLAHVDSLQGPQDPVQRLKMQLMRFARGNPKWMSAAAVAFVVLTILFLAM